MPAKQPGLSASMWRCVLYGALAGGLAWGIRGQYGHETGAMLAGALIGLTLTLILCPHANALAVARAVAWGTVAIGMGGSMTYGQTVGLTQTPALVGNWGALCWGMLGLALKGSLWIGFGAAFLGMGLSGVRYRVREMLIVMPALIGLSLLGMWLLNEPFRPAERILPPLYFSADWRWEPTAVLKPRREFWGGMLCALTGLLVYVSAYRRDHLALRLALWGMLGGALGFPGGQCLQAFHAWNMDLFASGTLMRADPLINWWNFMETTFGVIMGATLGLGLWVHRQRIAVTTTSPPVTIPGWVECLLIAVHIFLLLCGEFNLVPELGWIYDPGLLLAFIPLIAITGGRKWPYWLLFPILIVPIAGKTLRHLAYENQEISRPAGALLYVGIPVTLMVINAIVSSRSSVQDRPARPLLWTGLLLITWVSFALNLAFFRFPWPWLEWTRRTPNALVFTICALGLTYLALKSTGRSTSP